jgi:putative FmdB family regulatory protein
MPVYEYVCGPCQTRFERYVQRFNDAVQCPRCQRSEVEKQLSTFALGAPAGSPERAPRGSGACCGGGCGCRPA